MHDLATFQCEFASALMADGQAAPHFRSQAFAVYRNTSARGVVEALRASYPTVDMLVGDEMFTQVALDYHREQPPAGPILSEYGAGLAGYLARQPWTSELPYLADVAHLDWLWLESFLAPDAFATPGAVGCDARVSLHPATRFAWLSTPAMTIWLAHRNSCEIGGLEPEWKEEGALFTRPGLSVCAELMDPSFHQLLLACTASSTVPDLVASLTAEFSAADISELVHRGVASGALLIQ